MNSDSVIQVELGERSYPIIVMDGILGIAHEYLPPEFKGRSCALVTPESLVSALGEPLCQSLIKSGIHSHLISVPDGEAEKNIQSATQIIDQMAGYGLDRKSFVIALGGGVISDIAGFAASIYMRGIDYVPIPTTLLAQVDASVGGKVAVNHQRAKNLIGSFHQPRCVLIDPSTLRSLPAREFRSGMAEVIKYGVIADECLFSYVERQLHNITKLDAGSLTHVIVSCCRIKSDIVKRDERDQAERALLNYGHTIGHAIEACEYGRYTHGEAVSIGMSGAIRIANRIGLIDDDSVNRQDNLLQKAGLPIHWDRGSREAALQAMRLDKKTVSGSFRFVLPREIGAAELVDQVPLDALKDVLAEITR